MAIAFDTATTGTTGGTATVTTSHTMSSGASGVIWHFIACIASGGDAATLTNHTYNGVASTPVFDTTISYSNSYNIYIRVSLAPASGAHNSVSTFSGNTSGGCQNLSYTGVSQVSTFDNSGSGSGNVNGSTVSSSTPTTVADNCWKFFWFTSATGTHAASTGSTSRSINFNAAGFISSIFDSNSSITPAGSSLSMGVSVTGSTNYVFNNFTFAPFIYTYSQLDTLTISEPPLTFNVTKYYTNADTVSLTDSFSEPEWSNKGKSTASPSNTAKSAAPTYSNTSKNSASFTNLPKS